MRADWVSAGVLLLVLLTLAVFALAVLLLWRHGYVRGWRAARKGPPTCLACGYNLSGLTHCRCPECGTQHRIEQLWRGSATPAAPERTGTRRGDGEQEL